MIQYHIFPGGKRRIVTFSYDDGSDNDARLVGLFNKYGVRATFHLNSDRIPKERYAEFRERYAGHEISCHTVHHGWPARMPTASLIGEIMLDRKALEEIAGYPVVGMSYPSGSFSPEVEEVHRLCGILYSRSVDSTNDFPLPTDFLHWRPTCHHKGALALTDRFIADLDSEWRQPLFYIWGHSHEFRTEEDWAYMEEVVSRLSRNDKIWYATKIEIVRYMTAQRALEISVDEDVFYNPTAIDVWVEKDKKRVIRVPAGQVVRI